MRPAPMVPTILPSKSKAFLAMSETTQSPRSIISCAGTKFLTSKRILMTTCSATDTTLDPDTLVKSVIFSGNLNCKCIYLEDLDSVVNSGIEIDVVGSNTRGDAELKVLSFLENFAGQVAYKCMLSYTSPSRCYTISSPWVERSGNENFGLIWVSIMNTAILVGNTYIDDVFLKVAVWAFLAARNLSLVSIH